MRRLVLAIPFIVVAAVAACSKDDPLAPTIEEARFAPALGVDLGASTQTLSGLYYRDITVGAGDLVPDANGVYVEVGYIGYLRTGREFDRSDTIPLKFTTGTGAVVDGFDEGVRGMRIGGQRQVIIPPELAYGPRKSGSIPPNSILVFLITLDSLDY